MQKYFIVSDLHLEFRQGKEKEFWESFPTHKAKVCICAGDLTAFGLPSTIITDHFLGLCKRFDKVIYVPGNHEYYGSNPTDVQSGLVSLENVLSPTLKVLRAGEPYTFEGQRFIGDTMWFPDRPQVHIYRKMINDTLQIKDLFPWCFTQSTLFLNWLKQHMTKDDIIISHHVPTEDNVATHWKFSPTQPYFVNIDCDRLLHNPNTIMPKAWIYGHTHDKHDYKIGPTRFICNPAGYPNENGHVPECIEPCVFEL